MQGRGQCEVPLDGARKRGYLSVTGNLEVRNLGSRMRASGDVAVKWRVAGLPLQNVRVEAGAVAEGSGSGGIGWGASPKWG